MKVSAVPAQITTIEDRIVGSLGASQLLLIATPIFGSVLIYVALPPSLHNAIYKIVAMTVLSLICGLLAVRIKGKVLIFWLTTILRYNLRPRYYVFNKRSLHGRELFDRPIKIKKDKVAKTVKRPVREKLPLTTAEIAKLYSLIDNPAANVHFGIKKGVLYVRATEVKQES